MNKSQLIEGMVAKHPALSAHGVETAVNLVFDSITAELVRDGRVEVRGFGSFSVRHRRAKQGRNPKAGASIAVPAKRVPFFVRPRQRVRTHEGRRLGAPDLYWLRRHDPVTPPRASCACHDASRSDTAGGFSTTLFRPSYAKRDGCIDLRRHLSAVGLWSVLYAERTPQACRTRRTRGHPLRHIAGPHAKSGYPPAGRAPPTGSATQFRSTPERFVHRRSAPLARNDSLSA